MQQSGWTPELVKEHLLTILDERDKAVRAALAAAEKAIQVAEVNAEKWRANANEWRAAMTDRESRFGSKTEIELQMRAINERLKILELSQANTLGKGAGFSLIWAAGIALTGLAIAGFALLR